MSGRIHQYMTKTKLIEQLQKKEKEITLLNNMLEKSIEEVEYLHEVARSKECKCGHSQ